MADVRLLDRASRLRTGRTPFVLATVVRAERPTSARPGDQALVLADGTMEGFVGGSCAESTTRAESLRVLTSGEAGLLRITPGGGTQPAPPGVRVVDNPCLSGGALDIFLEPVLPPALVLVRGESPVARALVRLGGALDHDVQLVDDPAAPLPVDTAAVVVASHGQDEEEVLAAALTAGVPYVALVASRQRAAGVLAAVAAREVLGVERVHAPAGLDIGARTPGEIALSVFAQIVALRSAPARRHAAAAAGAGDRPGVRDGGAAGAPTPSASDPEQGTVWFCGPGCRTAYLADPRGFRS
jgi:xanthine dehydrogenase accessory factor